MKIRCPHCGEHTLEPHDREQVCQGCLERTTMDTACELCEGRAVLWFEHFVGPAEVGDPPGFQVPCECGDGRARPPHEADYHADLLALEANR